MPAISESIVVLPDPVGPRMVTNSPCATARSTLSAAATLEYRLLTPRGGYRSLRRRHGAIGGRQRLVDDRIVMRRRQEPLGVLVGPDALFLQRGVKGQRLVAVARRRLAIILWRRAVGKKTSGKSPASPGPGPPSCVSCRAPPAPASNASRDARGHDRPRRRPPPARRARQLPRPCSGRCHCRCRHA